MNTMISTGAICTYIISTISYKFMHSLVHEHAEHCTCRHRILNIKYIIVLLFITHLCTQEEAKLAYIIIVS